MLSPRNGCYRVDADEPNVTARHGQEALLWIFFVLCLSFSPFSLSVVRAFVNTSSTIDLFDPFDIIPVHVCLSTDSFTTIPVIVLYM